MQVIYVISCFIKWYLIFDMFVILGRTWHGWLLMWPVVNELQLIMLIHWLPSWYIYSLCFVLITYHKTMTCNRDARDEKNCEIIKQSWDFIWVINHRFLLGVYLWTHLSWYQGYSALFWSHWLVSWGGDVWALSASSPSLLLISTGSWSAITDNIKVRPQQSSPGSIKPDQTALWYLLSVSHGGPGLGGSIISFQIF